MLDQDNNFYLISLIILSNSLLDYVWILQGEALGVQGLICNFLVIIKAS